MAFRIFPNRFLNFNGFILILLWQRCHVFIFSEIVVYESCTRGPPFFLSFIHFFYFSAEKSTFIRTVNNIQRFLQDPRGFPSV